MKVIWALVNCTSEKEADTIGSALLEKRLVSCFDIFPRTLTKYFWPAGSDKIERGGGVLLVLETVEDNYEKITEAVPSMHSDELPFIGYLEIKGVSQPFRDWMKGELSG